MDILFDLYLCYRLPSIQSSIKRDQERLIPVINNFGTFNGCNLDLVVNFAIDILPSWTSVVTCQQWLENDIVLHNNRLA